MRNKLLRLSIIGLGCALFVIFGLNGSPAGAFSGGPPPSRTGASALGSFAAETTCTACHTTFPLNSGPGTLTITGLPANYSPNQEVAVTVTLSQPDRARYGFEATVLDEQGRKAGELVVTDAARTRVINGTGNLADRQYIQHILAGVTPNGTNQNSWTFTWRAPAQSVGRVTFYVAGNAANGNGNNQGDYIYNINASVQPASGPLGQFASVSAASFAASGALTANGIAAGFGSGLSANTVAATTVPLPTQLDGTEVRVRDAGGTERSAGLFFVAPAQINYLIPAGTANGNATITVRRNGTDTAQGTLPIEAVSPGLFAANANGQGVAAAVVLRRRGGVDTFEPVAQFNATTNRFEPVPIDLGPETDQVFLIGYGSGFRNASSAGLSCAIGGTNAEVLGVAAVAGFEGLDQANIRIPRSLAGRGLADVVFRADNTPSNPLHINFWLLRAWGRRLFACAHDITISIQPETTTVINRLFKLPIIVLFCSVFIIFSLNGSRVAAFRSGPDPARSGAPGELTCNTAGCHNSFTTNSGGGTLSLTGLPASYTPNQEINLTVTLSQANRGAFGFEITALDDQNRRAGELTVTDTSRTQRITGVVGGNLREYITHNFTGATPSSAGQGSWNFRWKAPAQSVGRVTFYIAGNAANNNGSPDGDFIYTTSQSIQPGSALGQFASLSAASFAQPATLAANGIAAGFGSGLSANIVPANTLPLPTQLDGTEVKVRDAGGTERSAGLFFVAPTQINYLIPEGTANGTATITVRRSGNDVAQGTLTIESVAPGLFSANANGQGVAAAVVFRRRGTVDTTEPVAQFNSTTNRFEPRPIDLGPETDLVFLIVFGTGIRGVSAQSAATATIGGTNAPVSFAGATPGFEGLDQANISIPRSLIGRGLVDVVFRADNKMGNIVQINIR